MNFKRLSLIIFISLYVKGVIAAEDGVNDTPTENMSAVEVKFETSMGAFTLELNPDKAPETVANFLKYVNEGFYNNTLFHRVIANFIIQGGGFEKEMIKKKTHPPVINESSNGLKNVRGAISMARTRDPNSATSQFFINVVPNSSLNARGSQPGYTVFGKVIDGMDVIDKIAAAPTTSFNRFKDVPKDSIVILSASRKGIDASQNNGKKTDSLEKIQEQFIAGEHYSILDKPIPVRDSSKIEVVEAFSYGCLHCYQMQLLFEQWRNQQADDLDFWHLAAVWNEAMKLYARAYYAAKELEIVEKIHLSLFTAIVVEHKTLSNEGELADFFMTYGVDKETFVKAFNSTAVESKIKEAEARSRSYNLASAPEIIVNGKYRVDPMRAGGWSNMLDVVDFLVNKEREMLTK